MQAAGLRRWMKPALAIPNAARRHSLPRSCPSPQCAALGTVLAGPELDHGAPKKKPLKASAGGQGPARAPVVACFRALFELVEQVDLVDGQPRRAQLARVEGTDPGTA